MRFLSPPALAVAFALTTAASVAAQVPPNFAVVGTISQPGAPVTVSGTTGIFLVPMPTAARPGLQTPIPITGLPAELTVPTTALGGVFSLLHRPSDGMLFAGSITRGTVRVHLLRLQGIAVDPSSIALDCGVVRSGAVVGVGTLDLFPDGRVLLSTGARAAYVAGSGPAALSELLILDTSASTPTLTPVPVPAGALPGFVEGFSALTADGRTLYLTTQSGGGAPPIRLYRVDVDKASPGFGAVTLLHTWTTGESLSGSDLRDDGMLYMAVASFAPIRTSIYEIDTRTSPVTVTTATLSPQDVVLFGPTTDRATGRSIFTSIDVPGSVGGGFANSIVMGKAQCGSLVPLALEPAGGWGIPLALTIHSALDTYGSGTAAAQRYRIVDTPNPGGLPEIGNGIFRLAVDASGSGPQASWMAIGTQAQATTVLGVALLVAPSIVVPMSAGPRSDLFVPIPNDPRLVGAVLYAQGLHLDAGGLASSDGVRLQIVR